MVFARFRGYRGPNAVHPGKEVQSLDYEMREGGEWGFAACDKQRCVECPDGVEAQVAELERLGKTVLARAFRGEG